MNMWIVNTIFGQNIERHSAWITREEAYKQYMTLKLFGYPKISIDFDENIKFENGKLF